MNYDTKLMNEAHALVQLLASRGCKTFHQGDNMEGLQSLMLDGNSGTVFSVEIIPWLNSAEIRTHQNQHYQFPTQEIIDKISSGVPLFSTYTVSDYRDIPFISLVEEKRLLNCQPMHDRIDVLQGAPADASMVYFTAGILPGVSKEELLLVEAQYKSDVNQFNLIANNIIYEKMSKFPTQLQEFYHYSSKDNNDLYHIMQKKR